MLSLMALCGSTVSGGALSAGALWSGGACSALLSVLARLPPAPSPLLVGGAGAGGLRAPRVLTEAGAAAARGSGGGEAPPPGPRLAALMKIGTRVVRGKDWKWGDQVTYHSQFNYTSDNILRGSVVRFK